MKKFFALRQIVDHLGIAVASKFTLLASIFIYSRFMSVEDYGVLNLFGSYLWIFGIVMSLNLHTGVGRYIYAERGDFPSFLGTSLIAIGAIYLVSALVIVGNLAWFERLLGLSRETIVLMLVVVLGSIFESLFSQIAIFNQDSALLLRLNLAKALGACGLSVVLLAVLRHDKYLAVLYADAAASVILAAYVLNGFRSRARLAFGLSHLRYIAHYALPLIPYMLSLTLLSQFDRVMIDRYFGKAETGLYSLAYNAGVLLLMLVTAVLNVFNPSFFESLRTNNHARVVSDARALFALAVVATTLLILFGANLFSWIVPARYLSALDLIPVVALGGLCLAIFQTWVRVIAYANRTYLISVIATGAALLNIGLNMWLLPLFGYKIAAVTTVVSYLAMSMACVAVVNRFIGLFRVSIATELGYIALLTGGLLLFRELEMPVAVEIPIKLALLSLCVWHFRANLLALLRWKPVRRTNAA